MARSEWGGVRRHLGHARRPEPSVLGSFAGWVWRHLLELLAVLVVVAVWRRLSGLVGPVWTALLFAVVAGVTFGWPRSRRAVLAGLGCVISRHRLRSALLEVRATTRAGRLPLFLAVLPTPVGERVWLWCRAGVSAEDLEDEIEHLRAACWAREVRVVRDRRWSALVAVDVIRRDTLAARRVIPAPVTRHVSKHINDNELQEEVSTHG
jgi:hypothetical protein